MLAKESSGLGKFDLPEEVEAVLPSDPFEQLDIARKITSIALATRVSKLESESSRLRSTLHERDDLIADLQSQIESLHASLAQSTDRLAQADSLKERLLLENASLSNTVKKLNRDVSKWEAFRKTLMRSLQEEEDTSQAMAPPSVSKQIPVDVKLSSDSHHGEEEAALPPSKSTSSMQSQFSETVNSSAEDGASFETDVSTVSQAASIYGASQTPLLASYASTPKLTPPGSPPSLSASVSPTTSKPTSPRRHSTSFSTTRGTFDDRSSIFSSMPSRHHSSLSSSSDLGSQSVVAESMASEPDLSSWTDLLHSSTKLLEQAASSAQFPPLQRNLDQLESLSKKLKAKTFITEAPAQSVSVEQLTSTFPLFRSVVAESMVSDPDLSSWTDLLHSSTKLLEQAAPSAQFPPLQRNLDQLESLSKKLKAKTLITKAPMQSVSVE